MFSSSLAVLVMFITAISNVIIDISVAAIILIVTAFHRYHVIFINIIVVIYFFLLFLYQALKSMIRYLVLYLADFSKLNKKRKEKKILKQIKK